MLPPAHAAAMPNTCTATPATVLAHQNVAISPSPTLKEHFGCRQGRQQLELKSKLGQ